MKENIVRLQSNREPKEGKGQQSREDTYHPTHSHQQKALLFGKLANLGETRLFPMHKLLHPFAFVALPSRHCLSFLWPDENSVFILQLHEKVLVGQRAFGGGVCQLGF
jgi:hypothetical protein